MSTSGDSVGNDPRFVVLLHRPGPGFERHRVDASEQVGVHLDWMFELDGSLATWTTDVVDVSSANVETLAERLPDHRLAYLDFEGDVSGDRGNVKRLHFGTFKAIDTTPDLWLVELTFLDGKELRVARLEIQRNCNFVSVKDETRDAWALRLDLCR